MKRAGVICLLSLAIVCGATALAGAQNVYQRDQRVQYIAEAIEALHTVDKKTIADIYSYLYVAERNQCQAPLRSLKVECLLVAARRNCEQRRGEQRKHCHRISDVIVSNRLSERYFISRSTRYRIMQEHKDYRSGLLGELQRRYAALVTELRLSTHLAEGKLRGPQLASAIDEYCLNVSGTRKLSWQHCTAAVIWFIGTSPSDL
ncbi:MAG: hypothetical protein MJE77_38125 [Proteobacteria bacterium]|nr:hypothetical protein [Pseudomonadota bacterium]